MDSRGMDTFWAHAVTRDNRIGVTPEVSRLPRGHLDDCGICLVPARFCRRCSPGTHHCYLPTSAVGRRCQEEAGPVTQPYGKDTMHHSLWLGSAIIVAFEPLPTRMPTLRTKALSSDNLPLSELRNDVFEQVKARPKRPRFRGKENRLGCIGARSSEAAMAGLPP